MRPILATINDEKIIVAVAMGCKSNHGPKVNRVPHLREEMRPSSVHHSPLRPQTSRTRAKLSFSVCRASFKAIAKYHSCRESNFAHVDHLEDATTSIEISDFQEVLGPMDE
ncbi:hypothetical protein TB1_019083 [Malus domestica]